MDLSKLKDGAEKAKQLVKDSPLCVRTPLWTNCWHIIHQCFPQTYPNSHPAKLSIKLENLQNFGSFKIRGIVNQFHHLPKEVIDGQVKLVTMSAGNYGRAFTEACVRNNMNGIVVLPDFAPSSRVHFIESKGLTAEKVPSPEITSRVEHYEKMGNKFLHPFDDPHLFYGYGSVAYEILEDDPSVDVIVACCGGGGFLAGVSAVAKLINPHCVVYGVEPHTANTMYRSFQSGKAAAYPEAKSVASGLSPPYAGENAFAICKETVEEILLVDDEEIKSAVKVLYSQGLVVEPAGSAAFAALMFNRVPNIANKNAAVILTGRNMSVSELVEM